MSLDMLGMGGGAAADTGASLWGGGQQALSAGMSALPDYLSAAASNPALASQAASAGSMGAQNAAAQAVGASQLGMAPPVQGGVLTPADFGNGPMIPGMTTPQNSPAAAGQNAQAMNQLQQYGLKTGMDATSNVLQNIIKNSMQRQPAQQIHPGSPGISARAAVPVQAGVQPQGPGAASSPLQRYALLLQSMGR